MLRLIARRLALVIPTFVGRHAAGLRADHAVPGDPVEVRTGRARHLARGGWPISGTSWGSTSRCGSSSCITRCSCFTATSAARW
ncbi:MAG: hypothetical protein WDN49_21865 [Acetobacteraceae bacterium]